MAKQIRLKREEICVTEFCRGSDCPVTCQIEDVPIRDWAVSSPNIKVRWKKGTEYPEQQSIDIQLPEVTTLYPRYKKFKYKVKKTDDGDFVDFVCKAFNENEQNLPLTNATIILNFQNLGRLSVGQHEMHIVFEIYGINEAGVENLIEDSRIQEVSILVSVEVTEGQPLITDKDIIKVVYNINGDKFSGDTIFVNTTDAIVKKQFKRRGINELPPILTNETIEGGRTKIVFIKGLGLSGYTPDTYKFDFYIATARGSATIPVEMKIINQAISFDVNPSEFSATLIKLRNKNLPEEAKTFTAEIINPDRLAISVEVKPQFIKDCVINGSTLTITTKKPSELNIGGYNGEIVLKSGKTRKKIRINLIVNHEQLDTEEFKHSFNNRDLFFAKDKNLIKIKSPKTQKAYRLNIRLEMDFGEKPFEQRYSVPFFKGEVVFDIGNEIEDFFIQYVPFEDILKPYPYAKINAFFSVMNLQNEEIATHKILGMKFLAGKKPRYFPILTNFNNRKITDETSYWYFVAKENQAEVVRIENNKIPDGFSKNMSFKPLTKMPNTSESNTSKLYWENQNLLFEWFYTDTYNWKITEDIEHILGESRYSKEEKFGTKKSRTITLNTGWLKWDDIKMISEILESKSCYLDIPYYELVRVYPIGKKNELYDGQKNIFQMDLEFKIIEPR